MLVGFPGFRAPLRKLITGAAVGLTALGLTLGAGLGPSQAQVGTAVEPIITGNPATIRRLSEAQYKRSVEDIFGAAITVPGRFDPSLRENGLLAIGDGKVAVSASGFEQYELRSRLISAQVMDEKNRSNYLSCTPSAAKAWDSGCASEFFVKYGKLLYRRPLTSDELAAIMGLAGAAAAKNQDFYKGVETGLAHMLTSPNFIFRVEQGVPDPARRGALRLDDYSLATRISFLLWNGPPDAELLDAAESGVLRQESGLLKQVDRMIASPRFEAGTRAFFSDMFAYDQFGNLLKEQTIFPKYTSALAKDAQEQALRTIVDLLVTRKGDYRDLFTTKQTFMNRPLGSLYRIKLAPEAVDGWVPYTFTESDQRAGILTLAAFLMLDPSHEGRSSPTIRGKTVRELFMCQEVPSPPGNVDVSLVNRADDKELPTARMRLTRHNTDPVCKGCHALTDPIGLALENYDGIGTFRTVENGVKIDASGEFEGSPYKDAIEVGRLVRDSPTASSCLVQRAYEYAVGRKLEEHDEDWLAYASERFAEAGYRFPALMRQVAISKSFQTVAADKPLAAPRQTASAR